jgi:hypothetical protein
LAVWMSLTKSGHRLRKQVEKTGLPDTASALKDSVHDKIASAESRQQGSELIEQLRQELGELSARLTTLRFKPRRKRFWLV